MKIPHRVTLLDRILEKYYIDRESVGDALFEYQFVSLTDSLNEDKDWYRKRLVEDGYILVTPYIHRIEPFGEERTDHSAHITKSGEEFYEQGGYKQQYMNQIRRQEEDDALRKREVQAAEEATKAAQDSAKSSRSAARAAWLALAITLALAGTQYGCSESKDKEIEELKIKVNLLSEALRKLPTINYNKENR